MSSRNSQLQRRRVTMPLRSAMLVGALSLAGIGTANAQFCYAFWMWGAPCPIMESGGSLIANVKSQIDTLTRKVQQIAEFAEEASRWTRMLKQFQDMMNSIDSLVTGLGLPAGAKLEKVKPDFNVVEKCGGTGGVGGILNSALAVAGFGDNDNVKKKQQEICVNIQLMQNRQYNEMVDYLTDANAQIKTMSTQLDAVRGTGTRTSGEMSGAIYQVAKTNGEIEQKMAEFKARMKAYDTYIKSQKQVQEVLAQVALRGKPSVLGQVMKAAALEEALN